MPPIVFVDTFEYFKVNECRWFYLLGSSSNCLAAAQRLQLPTAPLSASEAKLPWE